MERTWSTDKQIKSILNYRQKGGQFRIKKDFAKIYTISKEEFSVLEPYIQLPDELKKNDKNYSATSTKNEEIRVEINSADTAELKKVRGIGPTFALRIVNYRTRLHGFSNINQLKEIKGIDSAKFAQISPYLFVNPYLIQK